MVSQSTVGADTFLTILQNTIQRQKSIVVFYKLLSLFFVNSSPMICFYNKDDHFTLL